MSLTAISTHGKPFALDRGPIKDNSLFRHHIQKHALTSNTRSDKFFPNFATYNNSSKVCHFYCLHNFAVFILKSSPNFAICILRSNPNFAVLTILLSLFLEYYISKSFFGLYSNHYKCGPCICSILVKNLWFSGPRGHNHKIRAFFRVSMATLVTRGAL